MASWLLRLAVRHCIIIVPLSAVQMLVFVASMLRLLLDTIVHYCSSGVTYNVMNIKHAILSLSLSLSALSLSQLILGGFYYIEAAVLFEDFEESLHHTDGYLRGVHYHRPSDVTTAYHNAAL